MLEGVRVRGVAGPGESLPGAEVPPSLEEAYLAEVDCAEGREVGLRPRAAWCSSQTGGARTA